MTLTVATLNTTAEAIIHLLTLLQIFMHQLEGQEVVVEMESKQGLMTHCNCKRWCNRFRSKRQPCTLWKTNLDLNRWPQALLSRPEARSCQQPRQGPRWFIVNPSCHRSPHNHPAGDRGGRRDSGAREPDGLLARQLLISRAGHQCDQLRPQAQARLLRPWCSRIRAIQWSLARYGSLMPEHQDFVRYGQLWMKEVGNDLWGSKVLMKKCKPQKNGHQQCDNFHAQVQQSIQHLENSMFTNFQGHSTHNCVYYLKSMPTPQSFDRSCRKIRLSCHQIYQAGWRSTFAGRHKLWSWIEKYQPEHIWMAPECGPCGGWNRLNKLKSAMMFDEFKLNRTNNYLMCVCVPGFVGIKRLVAFPAWRFLNQSCEAPFLPPLTCVVLACAFPRPTGFWENEVKSWPLRKPCFLQYMAADAQLSKEMRASMASHRNWPVFVPHTAEALLTWWPEIYVMHTTPTLVMMKLKGP